MKKGSKLKLEKETTLLANERTFLSYIRTTFSALILGFALIQLSNNNRTLLSIGIATIIGGFILGIIGFIDFQLHKKRIKIEAEE
ncbi:MAG: DUF202 domain-containing protein [Nanoarchaeota archaeon]